MSAFLVHKSHVAAIVSWYLRPNRSYGRYTAEDAPRLCGLLYAQNVRSVNHRYSDATPDEPEVFTQRDLQCAPRLSAIATLKACHSLAYQSCETDDWRETEARQLLDSIEYAAISSIEGYNEAAWSIEPKRVTA